MAKKLRFLFVGVALVLTVTGLLAMHIPSAHASITSTCSGYIYSKPCREPICTKTGGNCGNMGCSGDGFGSECDMGTLVVHFNGNYWSGTYHDYDCVCVEDYDVCQSTCTY